jgi:nicotinamidase-related amidase
VLIVAGEARSHCVRAGLLDILAAIKEIDPSLAARVYILEDCTSNVPGFEKQGDEGLAMFAESGMHVVQSTTPMTEWPGMPQEVLALAA